jgi:hypothetical protein
MAEPGADADHANAARAARQTTSTRSSANCHGVADNLRRGFFVPKPTSSSPIWKYPGTDMLRHSVNIRWSLAMRDALVTQFVTRQAE